MNFSDSEIVASLMQDEGYELCDDSKMADVVFVNTCSIRDHAEPAGRYDVAPDVQFEIEVTKDADHLSVAEDPVRRPVAPLDRLAKAFDRFVLLAAGGNILRGIGFTNDSDQLGDLIIGNNSDLRHTSPLKAVGGSR